MPHDVFMKYSRAKLKLLDVLMDQEEDGILAEEHEPILRKLQHEFLDAVNRRLNN